MSGLRLCGGVLTRDGLLSEPITPNESVQMPERSRTSRKRDITAVDAATRLGVSRRRVYEFIAEGRLPATRSGSVWLISQAALEKFAANQRSPGRPEGRKRKPINRRQT